MVNKLNDSELIIALRDALIERQVCVCMCVDKLNDEFINNFLYYMKRGTEEIKKLHPNLFEV